MGILANGFIGASGVFQIQGRTVLNNANPSTAMGNFARTGANRNITAGEGINSSLVSLPSGNRHPSAWMMPQKPGALAARNSLIGSGTMAGTALAVKLALADIAGSGGLAAIGSLIVQALADLTGTGEISDADVKAFLSAVASLTGSGEISDADLEGYGAVLAALTGSGTAGDSELTGTGALAADLVVTGAGLSTANVGQAVWAALASANNTAGTMGEKLNDAGSASNPWAEVIEAGYTAAEILRILAAHAAGAATGLEGSNPQFTGLDGTTVRIDGTYSAGTRSIDALDGS